MPCFERTFCPPNHTQAIETGQLAVTNHSVWTNATSVTLMRALRGSRGGRSNHRVAFRETAGGCHQSIRRRMATSNQGKAALSPNTQLNKGSTTHCFLLTSHTTQYILNSYTLSIHLADCVHQRINICTQCEYKLNSNTCSRREFVIGGLEECKGAETRRRSKCVQQ